MAFLQISIAEERLLEPAKVYVLPNYPLWNLPKQVRLMLNIRKTKTKPNQNISTQLYKGAISSRNQYRHTKW